MIKCRAPRSLVLGIRNLLWFPVVQQPTTFSADGASRGRSAAAEWMCLFQSVVAVLGVTGFDVGPMSMLLTIWLVRLRTLFTICAVHTVHTHTHCVSCASMRCATTHCMISSAQSPSQNSCMHPTPGGDSPTPTTHRRSLLSFVAAFARVFVLQI